MYFARGALFSLSQSNMRSITPRCAYKRRERPAPRPCGLTPALAQIHLGNRMSSLGRLRTSSGGCLQDAFVDMLRLPIPAHFCPPCRCQYHIYHSFLQPPLILYNSPFPEYVSSQILPDFQFHICLYLDSPTWGRGARHQNMVSSLHISTRQDCTHCFAPITVFARLAQTYYGGSLIGAMVLCGHTHSGGRWLSPPSGTPRCPHPPVELPPRMSASHCFHCPDHGSAPVVLGSRGFCRPFVPEHTTKTQPPSNRTAAAF